MEKIIFLDIDGVLNNNSGEQQFLSSCVDITKKLIKDNEAKVVVISSLQGNGTLLKRKKLTDKLNSIGLDVYDYIDPNFIGEIDELPLPSRLLGIVDYLKNNKISSYVILDDEYHQEYKFLGLNCYECDMWIGIQSKALSDISFEEINSFCLEKVKYYYRELGDYEKTTNDLIKVLKQIKTIVRI